MNKAFTLVELLGVIIIISLLALLTSMAVTKLVKDSKREISNVQKELIKSSAEMWGADNLDRLPDIDECAYLSVLDLKNEGLLDDSNLDDDIKVKITNNKITENEVIKYEVNPTDTLGCDYALAYRDGSGANMPKIIEGLVPVIYDEEKSSWVIADESKEWYDYNKQWWANAVILRESSRNKTVGDIVTVPESNSEKDSTDVLAMFVWIPRYEYTIKKDYGVGLFGDTPSKATPGAIDIRFISKREAKKDGKATYEGNTPSEWYTHPAFTFGDDELTGIWVGKFKPSLTSGNLTTCSNENCEIADNLRILPNVSSANSGNVSGHFYLSRSMSRESNIFGINKEIADTHSMKNSEWGAVAYLSQSKYGKYGNNLYTGANKEVYQSKYGTGNSMGVPCGQSSSISCKYNDITDRGSGTGSCGGGASTTGNITGIYDMSGGSYEQVMGYIVKENTVENNMNGFTNENTPDSKYYDKYLISSSDCSNNKCKGDAMVETAGWYSDSAYHNTSNGLYTYRGAYLNSGMFSFAWFGPSFDSKNTFRVVMTIT